MELKTILKVGFKICVAVAAGLAIFMGIDRTIKKDEKIEGGPKKTGMEQLSSNEPVPEEGVVQKMRNVQGTLGKLFAFAQALTLVVENFKKVFAGPGESGYYSGQPYYTSNPFYEFNRPTYVGDGVIMNRVSPFITEVYYDRR